MTARRSNNGPFNRRALLGWQVNAPLGRQLNCRPVAGIEGWQYNYNSNNTGF